MLARKTLWFVLCTLCVCVKQKSKVNKHQRYQDFKIIFFYWKFITQHSVYIRYIDDSETRPANRNRHTQIYIHTVNIEMMKNKE